MKEFRLRNKEYPSSSSPNAKKEFFYWIKELQKMKLWLKPEELTRAY